MNRPNKRIVLIGLKSSGKSSVGRLLARELSLGFIDTDSVLEKLYQQQTGTALSFSEIYQRIGAQGFQQLEELAMQTTLGHQNPQVIATGGGTLLNPQNAARVAKNSLIIYLQASYETLLVRWVKQPPSFIDPSNLKSELQQYYQQRSGVYHDLAGACVVVDGKSLAQIVDEIKSIYLATL